MNRRGLGVGFRPIATNVSGIGANCRKEYAGPCSPILGETVPLFAIR